MSRARERSRARGGAPRGSSGGGARHGSRGGRRGGRATLPSNTSSRVGTHTGSAGLLLVDSAGLGRAPAVAGQKSFYSSCGAGDVEAVRKALATDPSVKIHWHNKSHYSRTPLHFAAICGQLEIMKLLLDAKAHVDATSQHAWTPLHLAAFHGQDEAAQLLIEHGASHQAKSEPQWDTPLHYAAKNGLFDTVALLVQTGAPIDMRDKDRRTALHRAAFMGHNNTCQRLLDMKGSVDLKTMRGDTALHLAAERGHLSVCVSLVAASADVFRTGSDGRTSVQLAMDNNHVKVVGYLKHVMRQQQQQQQQQQQLLPVTEVPFKVASNTTLAQKPALASPTSALASASASVSASVSAATSTSLTSSVAPTSVPAAAGAVVGSPIRPFEWTVSRVAQWVQQLGPAYSDSVASFEAFAIDGAMLLGLTDAELKEDLRITSALRRRKILTEVQRLKDRDAEMTRIHESDTAAAGRGDTDAHTDSGSRSQKRQQERQRQLQLQLLLPSLSDAVGFIAQSELQLGAKLGEGAFGEVYAATFHGGQVVVKISKAVSLKSSSDLLREARMLAAVSNHPNIIGLVGLCRVPIPPASGHIKTTAAAEQIKSESDSNASTMRLWLVVERAAGGSLEEYLSRHRSEVIARGGPQRGPHQRHLQALVQILVDAAAGVLHMHHAKPHALVHRDLAARNILLDHGRAKISDFGMSRLVDAAGPSSMSLQQNAGGGGQSVHTSQTYSRVGPVPWMSPESIRKLEYSVRSDSYSFGMLIYETITGQRPFATSGISIAELGGRICSGERPPRPRPLWLFPDSLWELCQHCWSAQPEQRPDMKEIYRRLMIALADASQAGGGGGGGGDEDRTEVAAEEEQKEAWSGTTQFEQEKQEEEEEEDQDQEAGEEEEEEEAEVLDVPVSAHALTGTLDVYNRPDE